MRFVRNGFVAHALSYPNSSHVKSAAAESLRGHYPRPLFEALRAASREYPIIDLPESGPGGSDVSPRTTLIRSR
jgi:hypothetical protein